MEARNIFFKQAQEAIQGDQIDIIQSVLHADFVVHYEHTIPHARTLYRDSYTFYDFFNEGHCTTLLQTAVFYAKPGITRFILSLGAKADAVSLHIAAVKGHVEIFELLLGVGSGDASARDRVGFTACHYAAMYGNIDIVNIVLERGVEINVQTNLLQTPLLLAACRERLDVVMFLLGKGAMVDAKDASGYTPLCKSIEANNYQITKQLIQYNANVNVLTEDDTTPLFIATNNNDTSIDIFHLLMQSGADATFVSGNGDTPLQCACARKNDIVMVKSLLAGRANVNVQDYCKVSALHIACTVKGNYDVVNALIGAGADVNLVGHDDDSALSLSILEGDAKTVRLLISRGARVDIMDAEGMTVLHVAVRAGANSAIVRCLLEQRPDLNSITTGETALEIAVKERCIQSSCEILSAATCNAMTYAEMKGDRNVLHFVDKLVPADPSSHVDIVNMFMQQQTTNQSGLTALHVTIILKRTTLSQYIVNRGFDLKIRDKNGRSLLFYTVYSRENSILDLMLRTRADKDMHGEDGCEALVTACKIGNLEAVDLLLQYYSGDDALLSAIRTDDVGAVDVLLRRHCILPVELRLCVQNSPKTKSLFRSACIHFVATEAIDKPGRVGQNSVFSDENLSNSILCASTGWSLQNVELLRKNYRTQ